MKRSADIFDRSGPQFFRTATGIQWVLDALEKSKSVITFLMTMGDVDCKWDRLYLNVQDSSPWKRFHQTALTYQMQKATS